MPYTVRFAFSRSPGDTAASGGADRPAFHIALNTSPPSSAARRQGSQGWHFSPRYFASQTHIQNASMTAGVVHVTNLTPGSERSLTRRSSAMSFASLARCASMRSSICE
jgi:hypothetical protein